MPIYEVGPEQLREIEPTSFKAAGVRERADLQRLLRSQIEVVCPDAMVIAEEFVDWEDNRRRIDLLAIDKEANLVVIELKRSEDGGLMDLQAVRYAAMISTMTFQKAVDVYAAYLRQNGKQQDAQAAMLDFLDWDEPDEENFAQDVRVVLVSAEFSKELTTTVLWLNDYGLDIRCVRLKPYADGKRILVDVEQVIPLPEAIDYQVQVGAKIREERRSRVSGRDTTKYDVTVNGATTKNLAKRNAIYLVVKQLCETGVAPERLIELIPWRARRLFISLDGHLSAEEFVAGAEALRRGEGIRFGRDRWFCDSDELLYQNGKTYALTNQWGSRWTTAMDNLANAFPAAEISYHTSRGE